MEIWLSRVTIQEYSIQRHRKKRKLFSSLILYFHKRTHFYSVILLSFVTSDLNAWCQTLMEEYKYSVSVNIEVRKINELKKKLILAERNLHNKMIRTL